MSERRLPIGIQSFDDIRTGNFLYVDKTDIIYAITHSGKPYFLARPRRFGKSLLITTLKAYFEGKKHLFEGLRIAELERDWISHPVILIDFSRNGYQTSTELKNTLDKILCEYEALYDVVPVTQELGLRLGDIIKAAYTQSGKQVAVLIDEYDKPLLDALLSPEQAENHNIMRNFYGVLKSCDSYMCFLFLTGITKFAQVSIFSELNQLIDISMDSRYDSICGISSHELESSFAPEIESFARERSMTEASVRVQLCKKYDGYHFCRNGKDMYNPFSLLNALDKKSFDSYWFQTATPAMLFSMIENARYNLFNILDGVVLDAEGFSDYRAGGSALTPIIYYSGYLTIKGYDEETDLYTLGLPNEEVRKGFIKFLLPQYTSIPDDGLGLAVEHFRRAIAGRNVPYLMELFSAAVADLPTRRGGNMEYAYQVAFHAMLRQTGYDVQSEQQVIGGRVDVTLQTADTVYIFELKMDGGKDWNAVAEAALSQIEAKGYAARFSQSGKKIYKIALVFSTEKGGVAGYKVC